MKDEELAQEIVKSSHLTGEFLLRSGQVSDQYFDKYLFESDPRLLRAIAEKALPLLPEGIEVLAGLELGGVPIVTLLSQLSGLPAAFVRKQAKTYGTRKFAEGADVAGRRTLIVEDVVTSGGQIIESTRMIRDIDGIVDFALCVIDRDAGGREKLAADGIELISLFRKRDLPTP